MNLEEQLQEFLKVADAKTAESYREHNFTFESPPRHKIEMGRNWARVVVTRERNGSWTTTSVYAFVAVKEFYNKTLGRVRTGDIHKAASFKIPAKHARGNIFVAGWEDNLTPYGIVYLK